MHVHITSRQLSWSPPCVKVATGLLQRHRIPLRHVKDCTLLSNAFMQRVLNCGMTNAGMSRGTINEYALPKAY